MSYYNQQGYGQGYGQNYGQQRSNLDDNPNAERNRKVFIGGMHPDTDESSLRSYFEKYGDIRECIVVKDPATKRSRCFSFITFGNAENVDEVQKDRPHTIDGRTVETKRAMPREDTENHHQTKKMFVGGLKDDTTEEMLRKEFTGKITEINMIKDKSTGKFRGFCFVSFDDCDTVDKHAIHKCFKINGRHVEAKKASQQSELGYGSGRGGRGGGGGRGGDYGYNQGYNAGYGMTSGYDSYGASGGRGYGGGNYGSYGGYANDGWSYGPSYGNDGYGSQGNYGRGGSYSRSGYSRGGYGGGSYGGR